jgi:hypothetical protein
MSRTPMLIPERTLGITSVLLPVVSIARDSGYSLPTWSIYVQPSLLDCLSKQNMLFGPLRCREGLLSATQ